MVSPGRSGRSADDSGDRDRRTGDGELRLSPVLSALDHATLRVERPVRRIAGSARLNPLPHAGTISVFLLGVVVVSGLYITLFFEYGHVASYESVASMEGHAIQRVIRALHRYASAALVITTVIHGWRILTARRFVGRQRRWRWISGLSSLVLVWLAGVSGYWLVWDVRAQALNEVVLGFIGRTSRGAGFAIDHLGLLGDRSGSGFMLVMWLAHLLLTVAICYFSYRHLRRSKLPWLPPRHMMAIMGGALLLVSLALPVGMLAPAQPDRLIGEIPVDPFVLFLLPPLLSDGRWLVLAMFVVVIVVAAVLPRLLQARDPKPVVIDEAACTGCELCVIDCPYQALSMSESTGRPLAVVDQQRCVSCGICLGSCAFGAIELPGFDPQPPLDVKDRPLVIACDRHHPGGDEDGQLSGDPVMHWVGCAGAVDPQTIRLFAERGADEIQVVGCAPNECRYGLGNSMAADRLTGRRVPHPAARYTSIVTQDWVPNDRFQQALSTPGSHPSADGQRTPARREALVGAGMVAAATVVGAAMATRAPFDAEFDDAAIRVVVDHQDGRALRGSPDGGPVGPLSGLELSIDDRTVATIEAPGNGGRRWTEILDIPESPDIPDGPDSTDNPVLQVRRAGDGGAAGLLFELPYRPMPGQRILIDMTDVPPEPTVADGRRIFSSRAAGCDVCHSVTPGDDGVGPSLAGVASLAGDRVEGLSAEQYLRQSIFLPDQYVVPGWPAGQMLPIYRDRLSEEELDAVIGYLLTLEQAEADQQEGDS